MDKVTRYIASNLSKTEITVFREHLNQCLASTFGNQLNKNKLDRLLKEVFQFDSIKQMDDLFNDKYYLKCPENPESELDYFIRKARAEHSLDFRSEHDYWVQLCEILLLRIVTDRGELWVYGSFGISIDTYSFGLSIRGKAKGSDGDVFSGIDSNQDFEFDGALLKATERYGHLKDTSDKAMTTFVIEPESMSNLGIAKWLEHWLEQERDMIQAAIISSEQEMDLFRSATVKERRKRGVVGEIKEVQKRLDSLRYQLKCATPVKVQSVIRHCPNGVGGNSVEVTGNMTLGQLFDDAIAIKLKIVELKKDYRLNFEREKRFFERKR